MIRPTMSNYENNFIELPLCSVTRNLSNPFTGKKPEKLNSKKSFKFYNLHILYRHL